jgi:glucosylceramidase
MQMSASARAELLKELFTTDSTHIGASYLRVSIGASDLNDHAFSYDDLPAGQTDTAMTHFDLGPDLKDVVPVLKEILDLQPTIKILGSPWSAPAWMKTTMIPAAAACCRNMSPHMPIPGAVYTGHAATGDRSSFITVQNEPLHPGNNPKHVHAGYPGGGIY